MSKSVRTFAIWAGLLLVFFAFFQHFRGAPALAERSRVELVQEVQEGGVESVNIDVNDPSLVVTTASGASYRVRTDLNLELAASLREHGVHIGPKTSSVLSSLLSVSGDGLLVLGLMLGLVAFLVILLVRLRKGGASTIFALRKTTARLVAKLPDVTFAQVGGNAEAKERLAQLVDFLRAPKRWEAAGARLPCGVLLEGPPGCGKTLLARAVAAEAKINFFELSASELVELFVGVGASRVRDLFEQAAKKAPAIIFIDELDAVGRRRSAGANFIHQEREQALNQILVSMDGFRKRKGVVVIAATNRADVLDAALLRPGRFDLRLRVDPPEEAARAEILGIHLRGKPQGAIDLQGLVRQTAGFSGADLENLVNQAAIRAVTRATAPGAAARPVRLDTEDFEAALAAMARGGKSLDQLDVALTESAQQLFTPTSRIVVRAVLDDGNEVSGDLVWADPHVLKVQRDDGTGVALSKHSIVRLEALAGTAPAGQGELSSDRWARARPDAA